MSKEINKESRDIMNNGSDYNPVEDIAVLAYLVQPVSLFDDYNNDIDLSRLKEIVNESKNKRDLGRRISNTLNEIIRDSNDDVKSVEYLETYIIKDIYNDIEKSKKLTINDILSNEEISLLLRYKELDNDVLFELLTNEISKEEFDTLQEIIF